MLQYCTAFGQLDLGRVEIKGCITEQSYFEAGNLKGRISVDPSWPRGPVPIKKQLTYAAVIFPSSYYLIDRPPENTTVSRILAALKYGHEYLLWP